MNLSAKSLNFENVYQNIYTFRKKGIVSKGFIYTINKASQYYFMLVFFFLTTNNAQVVVIFVNPTLRLPILSLLPCDLLTPWYGYSQIQTSMKARQDQPLTDRVDQEKC